MFIELPVCGTLAFVGDGGRLRVPITGQRSGKRPPCPPASPALPSAAQRWGGRAMQGWPRQGCPAAAHQLPSAQDDGCRLVASKAARPYQPLGPGHLGVGTHRSTSTMRMQIPLRPAAVTTKGSSPRGMPLPIAPEWQQWPPGRSSPPCLAPAKQGAPCLAPLTLRCQVLPARPAAAAPTTLATERTSGGRFLALPSQILRMARLESVAKGAVAPGKVKKVYRRALDRLLL